MARKMINVEDFISATNNCLQLSDEELLRHPKPIGDAQSYRRGVAAQLEFLLSATNEYHGFNYQDSEKLPDGTLKPDHDDSRRIYYYR